MKDPFNRCDFAHTIKFISNGWRTFKRTSKIFHRFVQTHCIFAVAGENGELGVKKTKAKKYFFEIKVIINVCGCQQRSSIGGQLSKLDGFQAGTSTARHIKINAVLILLSGFFLLILLSGFFPCSQWSKQSCAARPVTKCSACSKNVD